ncbi:MAG: phosphoenolpyruvate kinase, partial [Bacteroidetes bacterium RIFCSPLOWO2_02_FULL_36_8]
TVYGGAQLFKSDTAVKMGKVALNAVSSFAPDSSTFARALNLTGDSDLHNTIYKKVIFKLGAEPIEDFRIDFEDGFGNRPDDEEDEVSVSAALETAKGMSEKTLPPYIGIRIKPFTEELKKRAIRTLDLYLSTLLLKTKGKLPANFLVTLPKVTIPEQVTALDNLLTSIEKNLKIKKGAIPIEIMIETTQSILDAQGRSNILALVKAGNGRCKGAHFGTYDYTASCEITAKYQTMDNAVCDFAKHIMKVSLAGTGVWLSDGATNVMPVPPIKGENLSEKEKIHNQKVVHSAWKTAFVHIIHSLKNGFYQGWDLHPAQLPVRYAAVFYFFLDAFPQASQRLKNFIEKAAQATLTGDVFDDAATGQGLLNFFLRALNCGAVSEKEITETGLTLEEVRGKSFLKILENRS